MLAVPAAILLHACEKTSWGPSSPLRKNSGNCCRPVGNSALPGNPATTGKAFDGLLNKLFEHPRFCYASLASLAGKTFKPEFPRNRSTRKSPLRPRSFPWFKFMKNPEPQAERAPALPLIVQVSGIYLSGFLVAFLHAADRLGFLFMQVQNINHILPFFQEWSRNIQP